MTDKELIKLAAKAVGIKHPGGEHSRYDDGRIWDCEGLRWWNPLTDDADALRLAIKLGIQIIPGENYIEACKPSPRLRKTRFCEMYRAHDNPLAATRRTIVHAAAEIGRAMP